jgi:hypothetical protein
MIMIKHAVMLLRLVVMIVTIDGNVGIDDHTIDNCGDICGDDIHCNT